MSRDVATLCLGCVQFWFCFSVRDYVVALLTSVVSCAAKITHWLIVDGAVKLLLLCVHFVITRDLKFPSACFLPKFEDRL